MSLPSPANIFALIIGINAYESVPLQGCVKDAQRFEKYLTAKRQVPAVNIKTLIDATRKEIIDSFHSHLIDNPAVPENATIIFYFAGHGSRVRAPEGWETRAADRHIETLCPVDDGRMGDDGTPIPGIPDLTINALLSKLAERKGDNVIVILDCCHAGGAVRGPSQSPSLRVREMPKPEASQQTTFPSQDVALWNADLPPLFQARLPSHILLAACPYSNPALENTEGGLFTRALLNQLEIPGDRSYKELIKSVANDANLRESGQQPVCYGTNTDRLIFDRSFSLPQQLEKFPLDQFSIPVGDKSNVLFEVFSKTNSKLGTLRVSDSTTSHAFLTYNGDFFPISHPAEAAEAAEVLDDSEATPKQRERLKLSLSVPVGRLHGANSTTQFVVMSGDKQIGRLKVSNCFPTHCTLQYDGVASSIPRDAVACMLPSDSTILDVSLDGDWSHHKTDLQSASNLPGRSFRLVDSKYSNTADVELSWVPNSNKLGVKWNAPPLASIVVVKLSVERGDMEHLLSVVQSIANFRYHLCRSVSLSQQAESNISRDYRLQRPGRSKWHRITGLNFFRRKPFDKNSSESESSSRTLVDNSKRNAEGIIRHFSIRLYELKHDSESFRIPNREKDYLVPSCQPIVGGPSRPYGIEVVNHSPRDVFPYLFSFDPSNYGVQLLNQATTAKDDVLPGFHTQGKKTKKLTIGFGEGGGHPITFTPGETVFFRLFISDEFCGNFQFMEQTGVSERFKPRLNQAVDNVLFNFSDAFLFKVVVA